MKSKSFFIVFNLFFTGFALSQVPKKVVVEHFTNTVCSVCASKNPGFYTNLKAQSGILHLAVHPSSPYASCVLNQHNKPENDARTNYYGVFGGTPRLVIQGTVISSGANYSSASIFTPYTGQTSPASIKIIQTKFGNDSIRATMVIKTEAAHSLGNLKLFVALAEDTVFYTSPNGETKHYDVFRKSLAGATGTSVSLPVTIGDSIVFTASSAKNAAWNFSRIYTLAILQDATTKSVVQSEAVLASANVLLTGVNNSQEPIVVEIFPVPGKDLLYVKTPSQGESLASLYDISGNLMLVQRFSSKLELAISGFPAGVYSLLIENGSGRVRRSIVKQ